MSRSAVVIGRAVLGVPFRATYRVRGYVGVELTLEESASLAIDVRGGGTDPVSWLYGPKQSATWGDARLVGRNDDFGGVLDSRLEHTVAPGTYLIVVREYGDRAGSFDVLARANGALDGGVVDASQRDAMNDAWTNDSSVRDGTVADGAVADGRVVDARAVLLTYDFGNQITRSSVTIYADGSYVTGEQTCCPPRVTPGMGTITAGQLSRLSTDIAAVAAAGTETVPGPASLLGSTSGTLEVFFAGRRYTVQTVTRTTPPMPGTVTRSVAASARDAILDLVDERVVLHMPRG